MTEENVTEISEGNMQDPTEDTKQLPPVMLSPHPLGGIQLIARAADGETVATRIDVQEAASLVAHLNALITMAFESAYAQQMMAERQAQETAQKLYVPRGG